MASDRQAAIEARDLRFAYGDRAVVDGASFSVRAGELVGLLGPNGSGKSTLIRLLAGVLSGYSGSARIDGREVSSIPRRELARALAVVPQEPTFAFPFTALETVLMGRHPHLAGLAFEAEADLEIARRALERTGALEIADRPIQQLSSGERQRVVFARALAQEPRVLLLDEPASFLDIRHQVALYDVVRSLVAERGCAVLAVMHDVNLAAEYCDRVLLLRRGRIEAEGSTSQALTYENLTRVFETDVYVSVNDLTGKLIVVPLSAEARSRIGGRERG